MNFKTAIITEKGGRQINEDCCAYECQEGSSCWVIADGLGGHRGGEVASRIAVENILESFRKEPEISVDAIVQFIQAAQNKIISRQEQEPVLSSMRTTIAVMLTDYKSVMWAHLGDSRLYYFKSGCIIEQTKDHSVPQVMADAGDITPDQIRFHEDRNRLLRALGKEGNLRPNIKQVEASLEVGDAFLLCTDGFWEYVTETEMEVDLAQSNLPGEWLKRMETRLLERVGKGHDNYTAIAILVDNL